MKKLGFVVAAALAGCATPKTALIDGQQVPRLTLELNGQPYTVKHEGAHPRPRSPSGGLSDAGGSIRGRVCGMYVDFDVTHKGDHVQLVGSLDNRIPAAIDVSGDDDVRHFSGNLGGLGVDFELARAQLQGHVGLRVFALEAGDDQYQGHWRIPGLIGEGTTSAVLPIVITGKEALWEMPPADQAALLPALLTCNPGGGQFRMIEGLVLGFGGAAADRPPESSAVYTSH
jgi:hypothetical protein